MKYLLPRRTGAVEVNLLDYLVLQVGPQVALRDRLVLKVEPREKLALSSAVIYPA